MICERTVQTHVRQLSKDVTGVVRIGATAVRIDRTAQPLGGTRAWFLCPACNRRCAILYPVYCRKCAGLRYETEHLGPADRATVKAQRLRMQIGGCGNLSMPIPSKPKWMRWHTYFARREQIRRADQQHLKYLLGALQSLKSRAGNQYG